MVYRASHRREAMLIPKLVSSNGKTSPNLSPRLALVAASLLVVGACSSGGSPGSSGNGSGGGGSTGGGGATGAGGGGAGAGGAGQGGAGGAGQGGAVGSGGSTAAGGAGGSLPAPDGGAPSPVTPTMASGRYRFTFGDVVLEIDPQDGGRVSKLALAGADLIVPSGTDPTTWGSVFWTSPRSAWPAPMWPPPTAIDSAPYTGSVSGTHVVVSGPTESTLGVSMKKDFAADATSGWITIAYTINATKALKAAPWEVSRVPRGGIVFFPVGSSLTAGPLNVVQMSGIAWFDDAAKSVQSPNGDKCAADGAGWTAYVAGGNLFLKKFADQPASAEAPGEGEVDVYPGNGFLEFEVEGPYTSIAAAGSLPWSIQWRVAKVPSSVMIAVGSPTLLDFARQQLAQ
jgi:hypothetical protein